MLRNMLCIFCLAACLVGCVRQSTKGPQGTVEMVMSAPLALEAPDSTEPTVYVSVREHTGKVPDLESRMEQQLRAKGYEITGNPSLAGYILQVNVVHAGAMDPQVARAAVPGGYGHTVNSRGRGGAVLITDVIVAARTMPKTTRRQSHVIASTSVRTKVADEEVRVAAIMRGEGLDFAVVRPALERAVIDALTAAFSANP